MQLSGEPTNEILAWLAAKSWAHLKEMRVLLLSWVAEPSGFKHGDPLLYSKRRFLPRNLGVVEAWPRDLIVPSSYVAKAETFAVAEESLLMSRGNSIGNSSGAHRLRVKFAG